MIGTSEFWANLLRPIPSRTPVTPTLAVLKLVTPLSLAMTALGPAELARSFFWLGASPVIAVLLQIAYLTTVRIDVLDSEPHKQAMAELQNRFGQNVGNGPRDVLVGSVGMTDNPHLSGDVADVGLLTEGEGNR